MNPPGSYAEWSDCLDLLEGGLDDAVAVSAMQKGTLDWASGVANLFAERISATFNVRLTRCSDQMTRELRAGGDETTLVRAMLNVRRSLALLHQVAAVPAFPAMLRDHLAAELTKYATRAQQSLEDSAKQDRSGRTTSLIRNNSLLRYADSSPADLGMHIPALPANLVAQPATGTRRRNILI